MIRPKEILCGRGVGKTAKKGTVLVTQAKNNHQANRLNIRG